MRKNIDPPYNTGNKDFKYNDKFVDSEDSWRHSKWLSFMAKRLRLARELLSDDGVIFISIDDNEVAQLKLLCGEVFGEDNFIANFVWQNKYTVSNDKRNGVTIQTEYIVCYAKNNKAAVFNAAELRKEYVEKNYKNPDSDPRGPWMTVQLYKKKNPKSYEVVSPTGKKWSMPWNYNEEGWSELTSNNLIFWGKDGNSCPRKKVFLKDSKGRGQKNLLLGEEFGYTSNGGNELEEILGDRNFFSYPKPILLIKSLVKMASQEDAIILDFFAGSGTTGHAVLELNKEDGGNRQFILCTNNEVGESSLKEFCKKYGNPEDHPEEWKAWEDEYGICRSVTYERIRKVIEGYTTPKGKEVEGIPANLKYYKTDMVSKEQSYNNLRLNLADKCLDLLCIKENCFTLLESDPDNYLYFYGGENRVLGLYLDYDLEGVLEKIRDVFAVQKSKERKLYLLEGTISLEDEMILAFVRSGVMVQFVPQNIMKILDGVMHHVD